MKKPTALNPISIPLNTVCLIEASAGTGKTYTMGSLYLRLLLNSGQNNFSRPLSVEQILVVTFTEAATEELKERIRERIIDARIKFQQFLATDDPALFEDDFLADLADRMKDRNELKITVQRLKSAEQNMDLAAIYTIHGFCRRMLMQYAFNSGVHFNLELLKDESELTARFANEVWRENFYALSLPEVKFLLRIFTSPQVMAKEMNPAALPDMRYRHLLSLSPARFIRHYHDEIDGFKQNWLALADELQNALEQARGQKRINTRKYTENAIKKWIGEINQWAADSQDIIPPARLSSHLCQSAVNRNTNEGAEPFTHDLLQRADELLSVPYERLFHYPCAEAIKQKLSVYKQNHAEKSFDDLLRLLEQALSGERGTALARLIRYQYPFAMIDEFQDTDARQYRIFRKIYMAAGAEESGFIMIGDPKQAIYKFRGADIFTYLKAAGEAKERFNLGKNWRSVADLVNGVNLLFDFEEKSPFLYDNIAFQPVNHRASRAEFRLNGQIQPAFNFYLEREGDKNRLAKACAASIQQWLKSAAQNQAYLGDEPLKAKDIAVLVRNWREAEQIKNALQELSVASVYLSDKSNVYDAEEAAELALILTACLNPANERNILNAVATALFALSAAEIRHIKQDENQWEMWVERFESYKRVWMHQGVLPMLHQLYLQESVPAKLLSRSGGERRLTDLLHLTELLQQAASLHENEAGLLRWFERQIHAENRTDADEQEIRLESERELVKIVTVHKSKGLEYDIVWLPFAGQGIRKNNDEIKTYYSEKAQKVLWDFDDSHQAEVLREQQAEEMRLLYVALTRAKFQLNIGLPEEFRSGTNELPWNALAYALSRGEMPQDCRFRPLIEDFAVRAGIAMNVIDTAQVKADEWRPQFEIPPHLTAAVFRGEIERNWRIVSFTALNQMNEYNQQKPLRTAGEWENASATPQSAAENSTVFYDDAQDYDLNRYDDDKNRPGAESGAPSKYPFGRTPFDFPHGTQTGTQLHRYFENCEFNQPVDEEQIGKLCRALQLDDSWLAPTEMWMNDILATPLAEGIKLAAIDRTFSLRELQFYLNLKGDFRLREFNALLQTYHPLYRKPWLFDELQGMVRGFIDLVFCLRGKYYLLDYKSNLLGLSYADYGADKLNRIMSEAGYDLQYLLYTVALHRYLTQRDPQYRYERDFGGVIYAFLRGMNGENNASGVYFDKPRAELIKRLDDLF